MTRMGDQEISSVSGRLLDNLGELAYKLMGLYPGKGCTLGLGLFFLNPYNVSTYSLPMSLYPH